MKKFSGKFLAVVLTLAMIVSVFVPTFAVSATEGAAIVVDDVQVDFDSTQVTVPVKLTGNDIGFGVATLELAYDEELVFSDITKVDYNFVDITLSDDKVGGLIAIFDCGSSDLTNDGVLFNIVFDVTNLDPGSYDFAVTETDFANYALECEVPVALDSAVITKNEKAAVPATFTVGNGTADSGKTVTLDVTLSDNSGIYAALFNVVADQGLTLTSVTSGTMEALYGTSLLLTNSSAADYTGNGVVASLTFTVDPLATSGDYNVNLTFAEDDITTIDEKSVNAVVVAGKVTVTACEHATSSWQEVTAAKCTTPGLKKLVCDSCGAELDTAVIPALDHDWGAWVTVTEATESTTGLKRRECKREGCDAYEEQTIPVVEPDAKEGWYTDPDGNVQYYVDNEYVTGFYEVDGLTYYFYPETGFRNNEERIYVKGVGTDGYCNFFAPKSVRNSVDVSYSYKVGWVEECGGNIRYYPEGAYWFLTGFQEAEGEYYFFNATSGALYLPKESAAYQNMGWLIKGGKYYALEPGTGIYIRDLYEKDGNTYYYLRYDANKGYTTEFVEFTNGDVKYFDPETGIMVKNRTVSLVGEVTHTLLAKNDAGRDILKTKKTYIDNCDVTFDENGDISLINGVYAGKFYNEDGTLASATVATYNGVRYGVKQSGELSTFFYGTYSGVKYNQYLGEILEGMKYIDVTKCYSGSTTYASKFGITNSGTYYFASAQSTDLTTGFVTVNGLEYFFRCQATETSVVGQRVELSGTYSSIYDNAVGKKVIYNFYANGTIVNGVDVSYAHKVGLVEDVNNGVRGLYYYKDGTAKYLKDQDVVVEGKTYHLGSNGVATLVG